jgi:hypothetical protein
LTETITGLGRKSGRITPALKTGRSRNTYLGQNRLQTCIDQKR